MTIDGPSPHLDPAELRNAVPPLRWIFWGAILLIFNISFSQTTNGQGFQCDILDDTLGMFFITLGVLRLSKFPIGPQFLNRMQFVQVVCLLNIGNTIIEHFIFPHPTFFSALQTLFSLVKMVAALLFISAMGEMCCTYGLHSAGSWRTTWLLYFWIYMVPLGFFYLVSLVTMLTGSNFNINLGPAALLLLFVFVIPVIHFFVSTSRMKREADAASS